LQRQGFADLDLLWVRAKEPGQTCTLAPAGAALMADWIVLYAPALQLPTNSVVADSV
jgi:hypothetical protein